NEQHEQDKCGAGLRPRTRGQRPAGCEPERGEEQNLAVGDSPPFPQHRDNRPAHAQAASARAPRPTRATKISSSVALRDSDTSPPALSAASRSRSTGLACTTLQDRAPPEAASTPWSSGSRSSRSRNRSWLT